VSSDYLNKNIICFKTRRSGIMKNIAFVFPGQGAQYVGMGKDIAEKYPEAKAVFEEASDSLKFDIKKMIFEGDEETLKVTENTQPAILVTSIAILKILQKEGIKASVAAGLSLGEYSAHVFAETMRFSDAVVLVRRRGKYMQEAVPQGVGTMAAIVGLEREKLMECLKKASLEGIVEPANFNSPDQIVIAGEVSAVQTAVEICKESGAKRALQLSVSAPFHCSMLKPASEKLAEELKNINLYDMSVPVVANVNAKYVFNKDLVKDLLIKQVMSPVYWEDSVRTMISNGVEVFVEIGPGTVLSGLIRKINKNVKVLNVENIATLEKTLTTLSS